MTTSPLKVEDVRAQFEAWAEEVGALPWRYLKKQRTPGGGYSVQIYNYMWSAWQASRTAIVIDKYDFDTFSPHDCGDDAVWMTEVERTLRAAGITVKGD